jgi:hypothetical protein
VTIGPSTTGRLEMREARNYLKEFLQTGGPDIVTNPSFHHYYVNGRKTLKFLSLLKSNVHRKKPV